MYLSKHPPDTVVIHRDGMFLSSIALKTSFAHSDLTCAVVRSTLNGLCSRSSRLAPVLPSLMICPASQYLKKFLLLHTSGVYPHVLIAVGVFLSL